MKFSCLAVSNKEHLREIAKKKKKKKKVQVAHIPLMPCINKTWTSYHLVLGTQTSSVNHWFKKAILLFHFTFNYRHYLPTIKNVECKRLKAGGEVGSRG